MEPLFAAFTAYNYEYFILGLVWVVATLGNPLAGLEIAVRKIAEKAKEETNQPQDQSRKR